MVGESVPCGSTHVNISQIAAHVAWYTAEHDETVLWPGFGQQAALGGLMNTTTNSLGVSEPVPFTTSMYAELKSPENRLCYGLVSADKVDLSLFRDAGGKMSTWQGMADGNIPTSESQNYYLAVEDYDPAVRDYFRYFQPPGIGHCLDGPGFFPGQAFESLVD
ncbi:hypothetical protein AYL99_02605 [Fonsecaea erecta]|uniref:Carboxylic ester hydrolase n=1 Tax=Fonsecaea erecta TaxID=1367422 RepID=A0A178ZUE1_9EURO|nr:hypothetical protein AYL99_02605 [Fonsecaea erecta]OAP63378.1 hypothetical protein AYL99_02605 [Fonsecaea erecta]